MTRKRLLVLDIINQSTEHLTAEQIFQKARQVYPQIALSTIYNNLAALVEAGAVRQLRVQSGSDLYDRATRHDHLVCRNCGQVTDLFWEDLTRKLERQVGGKVLGYELNIQYLCPRCKALAEEEGG